MTPRITRVGRDTWSQPGNLTSASSERAYRFEPTTLGKLRELYRADREPMWKSVLAVGLGFAAIVGLVLL
jgi:hypothetical protein